MVQQLRADLRALDASRAAMLQAIAALERLLPPAARPVATKASAPPATPARATTTATQRPVRTIPDETVLAAFKTHAPLSMRDIAAHVDTEVEPLRYPVAKLVRKGVLVATGTTTDRRYVLVRAVMAQGRAQ